VRRFRDTAEREWEVVVGRESWGTVVALFLPQDGSEAGPRQALMDVPSADGGNRQLLAMSEEELQSLFERSGEKPTPEV